VMRTVPLIVLVGLSKPKPGAVCAHHKEMSLVVLRQARACPALISTPALNLFGRPCRRRGTAVQLPSNYIGTVDVTSMTVMDPAQG
jgi:hypothetical protein